MRIIHSKGWHAAVGVLFSLSHFGTLAFQPAFRPALSNPPDVWRSKTTTTTTTHQRLSSPSAPSSSAERRTRKTWTLAASSSVANAGEETSTSSSTTEADTAAPDGAKQNVEVARTKQELLDLSRQTSRGFRATGAQRRRARQLIFEQLAPHFDPDAVEPARAYYKNKNASMKNDDEKLSLQGKWELVYTDAPDITSLEQNNLAELGRIGQECEAPFIKNVIEWRPPPWAANLPLSGANHSDKNRVLQKVVTQGTADPARPATVQLQVAGLQIETAADDDDDKNDSNTTTSLSWTDAVRRKGLVAGLLQQRPINLANPDNALPFGTFDVVYLDETMRVTRTGQNFVAVNRRLREEVDDDEVWF